MNFNDNYIVTRSWLQMEQSGAERCAERIAKKGSGTEQWYKGFAYAMRQVLQKGFWNYRRGSACEHPAHLESFAMDVFQMRERQKCGECTKEEVARLENLVDRWLDDFPEVKEACRKWTEFLHDNPKSDDNNPF